ncbi:MAG: hypothetical protein QOH95_1627, partial [Gaiellaceae bacterium]|nr:hypothetical protein [Gaiellaceae bacterium]
NTSRHAGFARRRGVEGALAINHGAMRLAANALSMRMATGEPAR